MRCQQQSHLLQFACASVCLSHALFLSLSLTCNLLHTLITFSKVFSCFWLPFVSVAVVAVAASNAAAVVDVAVAAVKLLLSLVHTYKHTHLHSLFRLACALSPASLSVALSQPVLLLTKRKRTQSEHAINNTN